MHSVVGHSLDVAAVATLLPRRHGPPIPAQTLGFLVALHDIGKFSRGFQSMAPEHWPADALGPLPSRGIPVGPRHDAMGFHMLHNDLAGALDHVLPERIHGRWAWDFGTRAKLLRALAGHHGRPPQSIIRPGPDLLCRQCIEAAGSFVAAMRAVFAPQALPCHDDHGSDRLAWHLAGLTTLADWIGSRQAWFPYVDVQAVADPAAYFWNHAMPRAAAALAAAGLIGTRPAAFHGIRRLFPRIENTSPVQDWAGAVELPPGPVLAVIEDLTGSGKTEAAMVLVHRLLAGDRASGVFLALPTMATANAMFGRLADAYRGLFVAEAHPSLALAHRRAELDPRFAASIPVDGLPQRPTGGDPADEAAESHCAAWLAEDRRRALLAQVGVGTLDQALLATLPVRHAALRLQGLVGKVLVVDEVHAFDAYMQRELLTLLEFHAALGGSAVLLSATLPRKSRAELIAAFQKGLGARQTAPASSFYPLATLVGREWIAEQPCAPREGLPRRVVVTRLPDEAAALERILAAHAGGGAIVWVRNTVDDAIAAAEALRTRGVDALLFHARFAMVDRLAIEAEVLRRFGRDSNSDRRGVLVATQVIEQSLDLDFDLMVTDLAPVDLLIQRAGRLWRHARGPRVMGRPELLVVSPDPVAEPSADWIAGPQPGTAAVYRDPALLWRSARALFSRGAIVTPEDMRPLIEVAYDTTAPDAVPAALAGAASRAAGKERAAVGVARQSVLEFGRPYDRDAGFWEPETHTPTRLEDIPQVTLRLALIRDGAVVPYAEDPDIARAWALSEVTVAQHRIASCPIPSELGAAASGAKADWGRWERESDRVVLAVMRAEVDGFRLGALDGSGRSAEAHYSARQGLTFGKEYRAPAVTSA
jgi:CRISPR-associated endonuclease/helicase Cas3